MLSIWFFLNELVVLAPNEKTFYEKIKETAIAGYEPRPDEMKAARGNYLNQLN
jgi:hypothetical protein